jgi:hypothetical protein
MMKLGESSRAYADRYRRLYGQYTEEMLTLDQCRKYWIAGLKKEIKREVRIGNPGMFEAAVKLAVTIETADCANDIDDARLRAGVKPKPQVKNRSADVAGGEYIADEAAGLTSKPNVKEEESHPPNEGAAVDEDSQFKDFYTSMGPQVTEDVSVDDLVK